MFEVHAPNQINIHTVKVYTVENSIIQPFIIQIFNFMNSFPLFLKLYKPLDL